MPFGHISSFIKDIFFIFIACYIQFLENGMRAMVLLQRCCLVTSSYINMNMKHLKMDLIQIQRFSHFTSKPCAFF